MSDTNVVALPGFSVPNDEPVETIVALLEEALGEARSGALVGLAMVVVIKEPMLFETRYHATGGSRHSLAAGVLTMGYQIGKLMGDGED